MGECDSLGLFLTVFNCEHEEPQVMARDLPPPTPEGVLIRRARKATLDRLTIPGAAERAGISPETWGHLERGYKPIGQGRPPTPYSAQADIVAHAARVVGLKPADLQEAGRADAAEILAQMATADAQPEVMEVHAARGTMLLTVPPNLSDEDREQVRRQAEELAAYLDRRSQESGE